MHQDKTAVDGSTPPASIDTPGYIEKAMPEATYVGMSAYDFREAILNLNHKLIYSYHHRDPEWLHKLIPHWEIQKALQVITPSSNSYLHFHNSADICMVWGVFSYMQECQPNHILERHLAAVMPVLLNKGVRLFKEAREKGQLEPNYQMPQLYMPHLRNQLSYFFHCFWGYELDQYLITPYQAYNWLGDIQPNAMEHYYTNKNQRPPHAQTVEHLKEVAAAAYERGERKVANRTRSYDH
ncbi:MAG: hypothetical protein JSS50_03645 [Proteobacteria bacterium]|nr:hypothetical protein [Pseudomonadota bacterium]